MLTAHGNTRGVNLGEAGVGESRASLVSAIRRGNVATRGIGQKEKRIRVAPRGEDDRVAGMGANLTSHQVARDNSRRFAIDDYEIEHFFARVHLDLALLDLSRHGGI